MLIPFLDSGANGLLVMLEPLVGFFARRSKFIANEEEGFTAGVSVGRGGIKFYYNPQAMEKLTVRERLGVVAHEYLHVFLEHCTTRTSDDKAKWKKENIAKDLAINPLIVGRQGFSLPSTGIFPSAEPFRFSDGLSAEMYYELLDKKFTDDELDKIQLMDDHSGHGEDESGHAKIEVARIARDFVRSSGNGGNVGELPGKVAGDLLQRLMALEEVSINWALEAQKFLSKVASPKRRMTWKRPSKRYPFPARGMKSKTVAKALAIVDTSGSMSDNYLAHIAGQLNIMSRIMQIDVIQCDTQVNSHEKKFKQKAEQSFAGRGGTTLAPAFHKGFEEGYKAIICFTDGYLYEESFEVPVPTLWVVVNNNQFEAPFGRVINVEWKEGT